MPAESSSTSGGRMSAEDFISRLNHNPEQALNIHQELTRLTSAFVKKTLARMFGRFDEADVNGIVHHTFLIVYTNFAKGKTLDFSDTPKSLQSYFWRIADNLCRTFQRGKYTDKKLDSLSNDLVTGNITQLAAPNANPEEEFIRKEREQLYSICRGKVLESLKEKNPEDYRLLISYSNDYGKSTQEMKKHREDLARTIGRTSSYLAVKITRLRKSLFDSLQTCLAEEGL